MASTTQEKLNESFAEASGGEVPYHDSIGSPTDELASALDQVVSRPAAPEATEQTVEAQVAPPAPDTNGGGAGATILSAAETILGSGMGLLPLVGELFGLFGVGGSSAPPPLEKYAMPERQHFEGADTGSGMSDTDYDDMGMPREYSGTPDGTSMSPGGGAPSAAPSAAPAAGENGSSTGTTASPQIHVNVQTMDAQSFLDHSSDIAEAVRQAMLNLSSLNDVVNDL